MENRNGLIVDTCVTPAHGRAEVEAAYLTLERNDPTRRRTVGPTIFIADGESVQALSARGRGILHEQFATEARRGTKALV